MNWTPPRDAHIVYEAFTALADKRFKLIDEKTAQCFSSSGNKFYTVTFDKKVLPYFEGIPWKDINQKNKKNGRNNYMKSVEEVLVSISEKGGDRALCEQESEKILSQLVKINLKHLGKKVKASQVY